MFDVRGDQERAVEENLFALSLRHLVELPILLGVAGVPLKTGALSQVVREAGHAIRICWIYTNVKLRTAPHGRGGRTRGNVLLQAAGSRLTPGTGKTTAALVAQLFVLCRLLCLHRPQDYYGLLRGSAIEIGLFSATRVHAGALLARFAAYVRASPFFQSHLATAGHRSGSGIRFRDPTVQIVTGSQVGHGLGQSFLGTLIDLPPHRPRSVPAALATELFVEQRSRIPSRFAPGTGTVPGLLVVCVSTAYAAAFAPHLAKMAHRVGCYVASLP